MKTVLNLNIERAAAAVTGREVSLFADAMAEWESALEQRYGGARILVTGGAGFIASQTIRTILPLRPERLVVADSNENGLAELVRDVRTRAAVPCGTALLPRLVDVTSPLLRRMIAEEGPFDVVLAFAAAKHVRSQRDPVSALHMLNVNVNGTMATVDAVAEGNPAASIFVVSTDKAADPASMMGASKRLMELVVFDRHPGATTARFANVAFSAGSLLESWLIRLGRSQIIPVPSNTERYFVTPLESGQLCTLAAAAPSGAIVVPDPAAIAPTELEVALERLLGSQGLRPGRYLGDQPEKAVPTGNEYPVLVTPRDTPGEKQTEVFLGSGERLEPWITNVSLVRSSAEASAEARQFGTWIVECVSDTAPARPSLGEIEANIAQILPNMRHVGGTGGLDDRI